MDLTRVGELKFNVQGIGDGLVKNNALTPAPRAPPLAHVESSFLSVLDGRSTALGVRAVTPARP